MQEYELIKQWEQEHETEIFIDNLITLYHDRRDLYERLKALFILRQKEYRRA